MKTLEVLLDEAKATHGHVCAGQVLGVRMAMLGCRLVGIDDPKTPPNLKKLMVYVEIDRCATDAIQSVTGCRMGKRTLKFRDYGINAATFLNLETEMAYRIISTEESKKLADAYAPEETDVSQKQLLGYQRMPDEVLFRVQRVKVLLDELEMPGPSRRKTACQRCGQVVRDGREIIKDNKVLCRPCAGMAYFLPCIPNKSIPLLNQRKTDDDANGSCEKGRQIAAGP
jgi:formylmethanofuran dehydrogenase subunit E